eukprot:g76.t1
MYTTKTKFKGQDAFTKTGFLHVGDKYIQKTKQLDKRFKGKQLTAGTVNKPFGKFMSLNTVPGSEKYVSDPYIKQNKGFEKFVPRGPSDMAFGSKDASKRAEFSDTLAVRVYREKLKSEQKYAAIFAKNNLDKVAKAGKKIVSGEVKASAEKAPETNSTSTLFDAIFENNDDDKQLVFMKPKKSTRAIDRGTWKTTAENIGQYSHEANMNGIKFGRQNKMKDSFDYGHLS